MREMEKGLGEAVKGLGEAAKVKYIADVLRQLRLLSNRHEFLTYLIEMAEVEAQNKIKQLDVSSAVTASSISVRPRRELSEQ